MLSGYFLSFVKDNLARESIDLIFTYFTDNDIEVSAVKELQKLGVPTANFSCNNTHQFHLITKISPYFTYSLHSEKESGKLFKEIGANPIWFQMAANPTYYFQKESNFAFDVAFIGAAYAKRAYYINHLVQHKITIRLQG